MAQETLAQLIGRSHRWLIDVEAGRNAIDLDELERLADQLRVGVVDLVGGGSLGAMEEVAFPPRRAISSQFGRAMSQDTRWGTRVGSVWFPWVVAGYGPYKPELIESFYHDAEAAYPEEVEQAFRQLHVDIAERVSRGEEVPYDSDDFKLLRFHVSSRTRRYEEPKLVLHFGPTTYFRMLATDQRVDVR
jgi:transcriptional regulator with XRE-family HTH domain